MAQVWWAAALTSPSVWFQGVQDPGQQPPQPDKVGWIRKFCGRGIFRELWRNRFMVLRGERLYVSEKEVRRQQRGLWVTRFLVPRLRPPAVPH